MFIIVVPIAVSLGVILLVMCDVLIDLNVVYSGYAASSY